MHPSNLDNLGLTCPLRPHLCHHTSSNQFVLQLYANYDSIDRLTRSWSYHILVFSLLVSIMIDSLHYAETYLTSPHDWFGPTLSLLIMIQATFYKTLHPCNQPYMILVPDHLVSNVGLDFRWVQEICCCFTIDSLEQSLNPSFSPFSVQGCALTILKLDIPSLLCLHRGYSYFIHLFKH